MSAGEGLSGQFWVVAVCVGLALVYTVWAAVRKVQRAQKGGSACGGCSGDACGSGGSGCASSGAGGAPKATQQGTDAVGGMALGVNEQPLRWYPPAGRKTLKGGADTRQPTPRT